MNYKEKQRLYREHKNWINLVNQKEGWVKIYPNNNIEHENVKFLVTVHLKKLGYEVYTEAEFVKPYKGRCDIFAIKENHVFIIEILNSESFEKMIEKTKKYPTVPIAVNCEDFDYQNFKF